MSSVSIEPPRSYEHETRPLLERTWADPPGLWGWLTTVDHKRIGIRYVVTAFTFFSLAGILALLMRIQLSRPENRFLNPDLYNQVFTTHGSTMMFLLPFRYWKAWASISCR